MCVCVVFFFGLNQAHASNISYLAEAFIPICDQISESSEAKMFFAEIFNKDQCLHYEYEW